MEQKNIEKEKLKKIKNNCQKSDILTLEAGSDTVFVEYGPCGSSLHANDSGCGTSFGGTECYPAGSCTYVK